MESPTPSDWVAIVAQVGAALAMVAMGLLSHSQKRLTSRAVLWGLLFSLPWLWDDGAGFSFALFTFPVLFILLTHIGYGIRWILVRMGLMAAEPRSGGRLWPGAERRGEGVAIASQRRPRKAGKRLSSSCLCCCSALKGRNPIRSSSHAAIVRPTPRPYHLQHQRQGAADACGIETPGALWVAPLQG